MSLDFFWFFPNFLINFLNFSSKLKPPIPNFQTIPHFISTHNKNISHTFVIKANYGAGNIHKNTLSLERENYSKGDAIFLRNHETDSLTNVLKKDYLQMLIVASR